MFETKKIKTLRKKLKDKKWIKNEIRILLEETHRLQTFRQFECSEFFRGDMMAERNLVWYYKRKAKVRKQILFLESFLKIKPQ